MALQLGTEAPDFTLYSNKMEAFTLSAQRGAHAVLLLFFPGAFTSVCTTELNTVNNELDIYTNAGVQVAGISTDSPFTLAEFSNVNKFSYPLLSDHDATVSATYGVKYDQDFTDMKLDRIAMRSAFIIDKSGILRYAEITEHAGKMPDFEAIKKALETLA